MKTKFKDTEIGMIPEGWNVEVFSNVIAINPKRAIKKGTTARKISMQNLIEFKRTIDGFELSEFKGGSKFQNEDTLMARITPCLENGKTAYVDLLEDNEIAFGSTEFIVLSGKDNLTRNDFVYYLAISPKIRRIAIQSMTGTSGRQRIQADLLGDVEIGIPSLSEQHRIAKILSNLDSKIELLQKQNKTLEAIGQAIFKHWFVDFEFPNEEGKSYKSSGGEMVFNEELGKEIPKGWDVGKLGDIIENFDSKRIPLSSREREKRKGKFPYYGATKIMDYVDDYLFNGTYILMAEDGSVTDDGGYPVLQYVWGKFWVNNHAHIIKGKGISTEFLYVLLLRTKISEYVTGAVQPKLNQTNMNSIKILIPDSLSVKSFDKLIQDMFIKQKSLYEQIQSLQKIRDSLLPKLMSGKIRVPAEVRT